MTPEKILRNLTNGYYMSPKEQEEAADYIKQLQESNEILKASMIEFAETIFKLKKELNEKGGEMSNINLIIDALENSEPNGTGWVHVHEQKHQAALAAARELQQELAKPEQELPTLRQVVIDSALKGYGKPDQKPVAWMYKGNFHDFDPSEWASPEFVVTPLYTVPPCKPWVGLTDDEVDACFADHGWSSSAMYYLVANSLEFKLKEKNT
jgi:hypothetical protein